MALEKEITGNDGEKRQMRSGGLFSTKRKKVIPGPRYATSGNVTMSTNGARYRFPNPYGATQVMFLGIASRLTTAGFTLTVNPVANVPANGAVYENTANPLLTIVITGNSGATTLFALSTNPDYETPVTGRYDKVSGSGNSFITVTGVSAPGVDIRADVTGIAQLRPSYYFKPQSSTEVAVANDIGLYNDDGSKIIVQCGKWSLVVDENASGSSPEYRARAVETTLVNIDWPNASTIVVRAEVVDYSNEWFEVEVDLATNWILVGNFICT